MRLSVLVKLIQHSKITWKEAENNLVSIRSGSHAGKMRVTFPVVLDDNLGTIVGHVLGDGSISVRDCHVFFTNSNPELIKEFESCVEKLFLLKPRIWLQTSGNFKKKSKWIRRLPSTESIAFGEQIGLFYPTILGRILFSFFGRFASGHKKFVPIVESPEFNANMTRAFFDDEGSISVSSQQIRIYQDNPEILKSFRLILASFGIDSNPLRYYFHSGKKRYYFSITRLKNFKLFRDKIGFTSTSKTRALDTLIFNINPLHHNVKS